VTGNLIAFEGLDASGKSTQVELLLKALAARGLEYEHISFPRTGIGAYGEAIAMFLRGEFGPVEDVSPYLVASLFAGDRATAQASIVAWLKAGKIVIADRYFYSNLAFQGAKIFDPAQKLHFRAWVRQLEFGCNHLPPPTLTIFIDVPFDFVKANILRRRAREERRYLKGQGDIHEAALDLQENVALEYRSFIDDDPTFVIISRTETQSALDLHHQIVAILESRQLLKEHASNDC
jgi:dTMP kinase